MNKKVTAFLDCGCAITEDGRRSLCPSCEVGERPRPSVTPEQLAAYFNANWFYEQIKAWDDGQLTSPLFFTVHRAALAAHLAGNLAQAAMGLEAEAVAQERGESAYQQAVHQAEAEAMAKETTNG